MVNQVQHNRVVCARDLQTIQPQRQRANAIKRISTRTKAEYSSDATVLMAAVFTEPFDRNVSRHRAHHPTFEVYPGADVIQDIIFAGGMRNLLIHILVYMITPIQDDHVRLSHTFTIKQPRQLSQYQFYQ